MSHSTVNAVVASVDTPSNMWSIAAPLICLLVACAVPRALPGRRATSVGRQAGQLRFRFGAEPAAS
jgi:hypothetical protein